MASGACPWERGPKKQPFTELSWASPAAMPVDFSTGQVDVEVEAGSKSSLGGADADTISIVTITLGTEATLQRGWRQRDTCPNSPLLSWLLALSIHPFYCPLISA